MLYEFIELYRILNYRNGLYTSYSVKDIPNYEVFNLDTSTKAIGTNITRAYVDYVFDVNDPDIFPPIFVEALTRFLAASLAQSLVGKYGNVSSTVPNLSRSLTRS